MAFELMTSSGDDEGGAVVVSEVSSSSSMIYPLKSCRSWSPVGNDEWELGDE